jgi:hypothetical protein
MRPINVFPNLRRAFEQTKVPEPHFQKPPVDNPRFLNQNCPSNTSNLNSPIIPNRRLHTPNLIPHTNPIKRKPMILIRERQSTAWLKMNLNIASRGSRLRRSSNIRRNSTAKWNRQDCAAAFGHGDGLRWPGTTVCWGRCGRVGAGEGWEDGYWGAGGTAGWLCAGLEVGGDGHSCW